MRHLVRNGFQAVIGGSIMLAVTALPAVAGDNNILFIEQDSASGLVGNTLFVDQSQANNSRVAGDAAGLTPARQQGDGNRGDITLEGNGATVIFNQENTGIGLPGEINSATIFGGDLASIVLDQQGIGNSGTLDIGAGGNSGRLEQIGRDNDGTVTVSGTRNSGVLVQDGDGNTYSLDVDGVDTAVQWTQIGDNVSGVAGAAAAQVFSNAGRVTVTQINN